ncbi:MULTISPECIES: hypothetical protein [Dietzia]|jgi:hypothetical protein|uniref:Uncharacterized protein n=4 Tax=Dietzia TaxID=37914 RepID=A0A365PB37_9ACTN|nr:MULTISPECIES: hypothetical protein [Dietzia]MDN5760212.1 hypothetical protein [Tomitella sp.]ODQ93027.1 hypothetical protein BFG51_04245 [Dietzia alimentaria]AWH95428.1 hypothetical protein A6048_07890 [Dietzia psychralcaliphila]EYT64837.1 hypothetical protein H483_0103220 [Dietzia sp. UCD-THP]MBB1015052.1 hypothetical protein [Dietzia kunjamensis subsp. schimae]
MIALTTWTGGILTATGLIAYFTTGMESATSLIPAFIGVLLLIAAFIASRVPNASRGVMIAALVIAVLGALGSLMPLADLGALFAGDAERPAAVIVSGIMLIVLVVYFVAGLRQILTTRETGPKAN